MRQPVADQQQVAGGTSPSAERPAANTGAGSDGAGLEVANLEVVYNDVVLVLRGVSVAVPAGEIVAVLGANGAGKTTLLRAITGLLPVHRGKVTKGRVTFGGRDITHADPATRVRAGLAQVMEGRRVFAELTVDENLRTGAYTNRAGLAESRDRVMDLFPVLKERRRQVAGYLSGGEQQMLAMGRGLMSSPRLLLLDEPSLGLAPLVVEQIRNLVVDINAQGTGVLLVEQNATMALAIAGHGLVLEQGRVVRSGSADELLADRNIREFYLGMGQSAERRSFRDVKTYRRRKSWGA
ncbi:MAG TPA: ABC transporter ATP-binding protein [Acidimicrobiales bacterium]